jgi:hypothetical protein
MARPQKRELFIILKDASCLKTKRANKFNLADDDYDDDDVHDDDDDDDDDDMKNIYHFNL